MIIVLQHEDITASNWLKETQKGYIRIAALILLSKKSHHGYELMKEINVRTRGFWKPTAGGIYPILRDLQESGFIQGRWDEKTKRKKRIFKITESGGTVLRQALAKENQLADNMRDLFKEYSKSVLEVDTQLDPPFSMPRPLARLLKETDEREEETIKRLQEQRKHIQSIMEKLQKELQAIDKRLQTMEQTKEGRF
jgi:DNA-binding PadR family transcriptional regulator